MQIGIPSGPQFAFRPTRSSHLAAQDQKVRGIIVASEIDAALRYAARGLPNVSVKTYTVTFSLQGVAL